MNADRARERLSFIIPGDTNELSPNAVKRMGFTSNGHAKLRRLCARWKTNTKLCSRSLSMALPRHPIPWKVRISFVVYRSRQVDPDGLRSSLALKSIIDGLVEVAVLKNDTPEFVEMGPVAYQKAIQPEVEVILEEVL